VIDLDVRHDAGGFRLEARASDTSRVIGLFGPSGAGKTTLLELIAGIVSPDRGRIAVDGRLLCDTRTGVGVPAAARRIGYVFQDGRLFPHRSVRGNLLYGRRRAISTDPAFSVSDVVEALELEPLLRRSTGDLSGGERQRVSIARALLSAPRLLLLDEPLSALDERLKSRTLDLLRTARDEHGTAMLYVSHSLWEIQELTDHVIFLDAGTVVGCGRLHDVLCNERAFALASRLGLENLLEVEILRHEANGEVALAALGDQTLILPPTDRLAGSRARVSIRPGDIVLARGRIEGLSARNMLHGTVRRMTEIGRRWLVSVDVGQEIRVEVTRSSIEELGLVEGADVWLYLKTFAFSWRP